MGRELKDGSDCLGLNKEILTAKYILRQNCSKAWFSTIDVTV